MIVTAPTVHFRTAGGIVVVDQGGDVPADVDETHLASLAAAGCVDDAPVAEDKPEPKARARK